MLVIRARLYDVLYNIYTLFAIELWGIEIFHCSIPFIIRSMNPAIPNRFSGALTPSIPSIVHLDLIIFSQQA